MNPRLYKEVRPLLVPGALVAIAGIVICHSTDRGEAGEIYHGSAILIFAGLLPLLAALPFGIEFQHQTVPMLLTQPIPRERIWREKLFASLLIFLPAVLIGPLSAQIGDIINLNWNPCRFGYVTIGWDELLTLIGLIVAAICSSSLWTLLARTTIGGTTFTLAVLMVGAMGVYGLSERFMSTDSPRFVVLCLSLCGLYSAATLYLGRLLFLKLQGRESRLTLLRAERGVKAEVSEKPALLRCRPDQKLRNLIRKELALQTPVLVTARVFALCWLACLLLLIFPSKRDLFQMASGLVTGFYVPFIAIMAGACALVEERRLGLSDWNLTQPISAGVHWLVKLLIALTVTCVLGLFLPLILTNLIALVRTGTMGFLPGPEQGTILLAVVFMTVIMAFWASTFLESVVSAALVTVVGVMLLVGAMAVANELGQLFIGDVAGFILLELLGLNRWGVRFLLWVGPERFHVLIATVPVAIAALIQSWALFRRTRPSRAKVIRFACILLATSLTFGILGNGVEHVRRDLLDSKLRDEVEAALRSMKAEHRTMTEGQVVTLTAQELAKTGYISPATLSFLGQFSIWCYPTTWYASGDLQTYTVRLQDENGNVGTWWIFSEPVPAGEKTNKPYYQRSKPGDRER